MGWYRENGIWEHFGSGAWGSECCGQGCEKVALAGKSSAAGPCVLGRILQILVIHYSIIVVIPYTGRKDVPGQ